MLYIYIIGYTIVTQYIQHICMCVWVCMHTRVAIIKYNRLVGLHTGKSFSCSSEDWQVQDHGNIHYICDKNLEVCKTRWNNLTIFVKIKNTLGGNSYPNCDTKGI